jgi:tRNA C32,U32 (ribose-2'-O)-methylase TrmJ
MLLQLLRNSLRAGSALIFDNSEIGCESQNILRAKRDITVPCNPNYVDIYLKNDATHEDQGT